MTVTAKQLGQAAIGVGVTTLYTVPASTRAILKSLDIANTAGAARSVRVFLVPNGGSADTGNAMFYDLSIPAQGILHWTGAQILHTAGDTIRTQGSGVGMTITISGVEVT